MTNTRSAVVGTGFIGPVHVEALRRLGRDVVGILGSTPEKSRHAARTLRLAKGYDSFEQLLADDDVSVVHLASPNRMHFAQCQQALAAGKHVICEKPLAMTSEETAQLVSLAEQSSLVTAVCYNVRYYPLCLEARQRVTEGQLGKLYHVTGSYVQDWLMYDTDFNWRVLAKEGGALRAVADIGTHWLDLMQTVTDTQVAEVCADLKTVWPRRRRPKGSVETFQGKSRQTTETEEIDIETEDYGSILFRLKNGVPGNFTVSQVYAGRKNTIRLEIAASDGSLAWNSETPNELWLGHRDNVNEILPRDPALLQTHAAQFADYPGGHHEGFPDTFKQLFRAVYNGIDEQQPLAARSFPTFADGHWEVVLCEAILKSHQERRWIQV